MNEFLLKFATIAVTGILNLKKAWEMVSAKKNKHDAPIKENDDDEPTRKIKRYNIVSIVNRIVSMNLSEEINNQIRD